MREAWRALVCWWRGHRTWEWVQPWRHDDGPRLSWAICERCGLTVRQWLEGRS